MQMVWKLVFSMLNHVLESREKDARGNSLQKLIQVLKLKMAFHTLNMFSIDVTQKCLVAECWIPTADLDKVRGALSAGTVREMEEKR